jgi:hypothetical protein
MKLKVLQGIANNLTDKLCAWPIPEDLETLASVPDGDLTIDILASKASHSSVADINLGATEQLHRWLQAQLAASDIHAEDLEQALLIARIQTDRIATDRSRIVSFDFHVESLLKAGTRVFHGVPTERHVWHHRILR